MDLKNIQYVYVAGAIARQATTTTDKGSATYIADGEIVVTDLAGAVLDTDAASYTKEKVKIVYRKGNTIISSPAISYKNVSSYMVKGYLAGAKQVTYLGYNAVTGLGDMEGGTLVAATDYIVTLRKHKVISGMTDSYYDNKSVQYYNETAISGAGAQVALADGLAGQLITNFNSDFQIDNYVIFERVCSNAGAAIGAGTGNITVVNGSKTIKAAADIDNAMAVGDYIRIGTAVTSPMYKIASMDIVANTAMLDVPYQGTSATVAHAGVEYVTAALAANVATNWGIKMTGNEHTFEAGRWRFDEFRFTVTTQNLTDTAVVDQVAAFIGSGTYNEVAEKEWYAFAADALPFAEFNMPPRTKTLKAVSGLHYNWVIISAYDNDYSNIHSRPESKFEILIAIPVKASSNQGEAAGNASVAMGVSLAIDTWLTTMTGTTVSKVGNLI